MIKKNGYIIVLLIIYLLFLCKDNFFRVVDNSDTLMSSIYDKKLEYYKEEYEKIRDLLKLQNIDYSVIYSRVVKRDIYAFYDEVTISKGSNDGIALGNLVVNEVGVVGIIKSVDKSMSVVSLLSSPKMELSVRINNSYGILTSEDKKIIVKNIKLDGDIKENDYIYTSGLTNIPGSFLVGKVKKVYQDNLGLEYILEVDTSINLQDLAYVAIIGDAS